LRLVRTPPAYRPCLLHGSSSMACVAVTGPACRPPAGAHAVRRTRGRLATEWISLFAECFELRCFQLLSPEA